MYWANGGEIFDDKMNPIFASDTGVKSLEFLLELMKTMPPGGGAFTESDEIKAMAVGLATLDPASWIPDAIMNADDKTKPNLKTKVAPMGSARRSPTLGGIGLCVSNYSPSKEAAAQVRGLVQLQGRADQQDRPGRRPALPHSAWAANADARPWFRSSSENLKVAKSLPQIPEWGQVDAAISTQLTQAFAGADQAEGGARRGAGRRRRGHEGRRLLLGGRTATGDPAEPTRRDRPRPRRPHDAGSAA